MCERTSTAIVLAALCCATMAQSPSTQPGTSSAPAPVVKLTDHCKGAVDPYGAVSERNRFLKTAGVDNELSEQEFTAARAKANSFVRKFDRWSILLELDKNANKTIDWFEADAYRLAVRKQVLGAFDANKDGKLAGKERIEANRALEAGKYPRSTREPPPPAMPERRRRPWRRGRGRDGNRPDRTEGARTDEWYASVLEKYDKDKDGELNADERRAARRDLREAERKQMLDRYDTDGDGKLSAAERAKMRSNRRGPWGGMMEQLRLNHFDADNDGKINEAEQAEIDKFQKAMRDMNRRWQDRIFDRDGDGKVTDEERQATMKEMRPLGWRMMVRAWRAMDDDGDGRVSADERTAFEKNTRESVQDWFSDFIKKHDADGDGRLLTDEERKDLLDGMDDEFEARFKRADWDKDGRLNADEMEKLAVRFAQDIGVLPKDK